MINQRIPAGVVPGMEKHAMSHASEQDNEELEIFQRFAAICPLGIQSDAAIRGDPRKREPDFVCQVLGDERVGFELCESVDEPVARAISESRSLERQFQQRIEELPPEEREALQRQHGDTRIVAYLKDRPRRSSESVHSIIPALSDLPDDFEGELPALARSTEAFSHILLKRCGGFGPTLTVQPVVGFRDATLGSIQKKFKKEYQRGFPIELVVWFGVQPLLPHDGWLLDVARFITDHLRGSCFRRVWIFEYGDAPRILWQSP